MSMHTTLDLVLLLLDDINAGREIDPLRTEQLRAVFFINYGSMLIYIPDYVGSVCHCMMPDSGFVCQALNVNRVE